MSRTPLAQLHLRSWRYGGRRARRLRAQKPRGRSPRRRRVRCRANGRSRSGTSQAPFGYGTCGTVERPPGGGEGDRADRSEIEVMGPRLRRVGSGGEAVHGGEEEDDVRRPVEAPPV